MSQQHQDIIQFNCCGLRGQFHQLSQLIQEVKPKFVLLQELMIKKASDVKFKGYILIIKLCGSWKNPSVGILIAEGIRYDIIDTPDDIAVLGINTFCNGPISLFSLYDSIRTNKLTESNLRLISNSGKHKPIIMGDLNAKSAMWDNNRKNMDPNIESNTRANSIISFLNNSNCILLNDGSTTRISPIFDQRNSALDLTIIDESFFNKFVWKVADCSYGSDHLPTMISSNIVFESTINESWDMNKTDWKVFNVHCKICDIFIDEDDIDILDNRLTQQILKGLESSTPLIRFNPSRRKKPPWFDDELADMKKQKRKLLKKYVADQSKENLISLKRMNAKYKLAIVKKKRESWEKFVSESEDLESKDMWNRLRLIKGTCSNKTIKNLEDEQGNIIEDRTVIANMLGSFYQSISSLESLSGPELVNLNSLRDSFAFSNIDDFPELSQEFTEHELLYAIKNTKSTAPGLDGFKYDIFKKLHGYNITSLLKFYNKIWASEKRPSSWNISRVIPIPKSINLKYPKDTRPINLFNTRAKLFDKMVNARLIYILEHNNFLDKQQFGFRKNKQTLSSMLILNRDIVDSLERKSHIQLVSFDIYKAFDRVWPETILKCLQKFKIGGRIISYLASFLKKRQFNVKLGQVTSENYFTELGVPQGSPLSSTLFLVAFQGILEELKLIEDIKYSAYADDLIIYSSKDSNAANKISIQNAINAIVNKGVQSGLKFSYEKTKAIHFCKKWNCIRHSNTLENKVIKEVGSIKILGIVLDEKYKFKLHINQLKLKLSKDLQFVKIISNYKYGLSQNILERIVTAVVVSKIKYGVELYGNTSMANKKIINTMLNHFNRQISLAFITSPILSLSVITGIPSMENIIEKSNLWTAARMRANSDYDYPVYPTNNLHFNIHQRFNVTFAEDNSTLLEVVKNHSFISPIKSFSNQICLNIFDKKKDDQSAPDSRKTFRDFIERNKFENVLYTDGSKTDDSCSYSVCTNNEILFSRKLHNQTSIFTAEALGLLKAVNYLNFHYPGVKNAIASDSQSVLSVIFHKSKKENEIIKKIMMNLEKNICILWIPGHMGIVGNELADSAAYDAHGLDVECKNMVTCQDLQISMKLFYNSKVQALWNTYEENKLQKIHPASKMTRLNIIITRKETMILNRLKIGHSFLTHKYKLDKSQPPICEWCDQPLTIEHIFCCNSIHVSNLLMKYGLTDFPNELFDDNKISQIFAFLKEMNYYCLI